MTLTREQIREALEHSYCWPMGRIGASEILAAFDELKQERDEGIRLLRWALKEFAPDWCKQRSENADDKHFASPDTRLIYERYREARAFLGRYPERGAACQSKGDSK